MWIQCERSSFLQALQFFVIKVGDAETMVCRDQISTCNMYAETNNIQKGFRHWFEMMQPRNQESLDVNGYDLIVFVFGFLYNTYIIL